MNIDWDRINGFTTRAAKPQDFTQDDIDAAVAKIEALPAIDPDDPDSVATFWPVETKFGLADLDFGDETLEPVTISGLCACTPDLSRQKLLWHVANPGKSKKPGPFTANPIVLQSKKKQTIVDGEHRLAALSLLGASEVTVWLVPK